MTHWADNYVTASDGGPLQDHVDAADGVPDEVGRQDQGAEDQQPGLVRREPGLLRRNNMDVEASESMELGRHLDETGLLHFYTVCTCHPN